MRETENYNLQTWIYSILYANHTPTRPAASVTTSILFNPPHNKQCVMPREAFVSTYKHFIRRKNIKLFNKLRELVFDRGKFIKYLSEFR